jgi:superfamily II DNA or RNA helicase
VSEVVLSNMVWIDKSRVKDIDRLRERLTLRNRFDPKNADKEVVLYRETRKRFGFPRYCEYGPDISTIKDVRQSTGAFKVKFSMRTKFRDDAQRQLFKRIKQQIKERGRTGLVVNAPTGIGKTYLMLRTMKMLKMPTLIVVFKKDMLSQWADEIERHTTLTKADIGFGQDGKIEWQDKSVVIALVHTLRLNREEKAFRKYFGAVVFDEVDKTTSPITFSTVAGMFFAKYRIAITATPDRRDGMHGVYQNHIQEVLVKPRRGSKFTRMQSRVIVRRIRLLHGEIPTHLKVVQRKAILLSKMAACYRRNKLIALDVKRCLNSEGRRVVVFSDRTALLAEVKHILETEYDVREKDIGYYTASVRLPRQKGQKRKTRTVKKAEQEHTKNHCRVLLATFKMMDTATDIPDLSAALIATPVTSIKQLDGRVSRFLKGKKNPIIIDYYDLGYKDCRTWFDYRVEEYKGLGLQITDSRGPKK